MPPLLVESTPHATRGADPMAATAAVAPDRNDLRLEQHNVDASTRACMASTLPSLSSLQRIKCEAEVEKLLRLLNPPCELHATSIGPGNAPNTADWKECTGRLWVSSSSSSSRPRNGEQRDEVCISPCSCAFSFHQCGVTRIKLDEGSVNPINATVRSPDIPCLR